jgi:hypothetical protein
MKRLSVLLLVATLATTAAWGRDIRSERIQFERGTNHANVQGSISGHEVVDYLLRAREGQHLSVKMAGDGFSGHFNILAPGEDQVALFNGSQGENAYEGVLPATGDYKIRVYLMGAAAHSSKPEPYRLKVTVTDRAKDETPAAGASPAGASDAERAGTGDFDARGQVPCAQHKGQPMGQCPFGVARASGGTATVVVTRPDGRTRALFFQKGRFLSPDTSQADGYPEVHAEKQSDLNLIRVGQERYEIPDAVIFGG